MKVRMYTPNMNICIKWRIKKRQTGGIVMRKKVMSVVLALLTATFLTPFTGSAESTEMEQSLPALSEFETNNVYWIYYKAPDTSKDEKVAEQKRHDYIYELYQSGVTENEVQQKSTEYYQNLRLEYLKKA